MYLVNHLCCCIISILAPGTVVQRADDQLTTVITLFPVKHLNIEVVKEEEKQKHLVNVP